MSGRDDYEGTADWYTEEEIVRRKQNDKNNKRSDKRSKS